MLLCFSEKQANFKFACFFVDIFSKKCYNGYRQADACKLIRRYGYVEEIFSSVL